MDVSVAEVRDADERAAVCEGILRALPAWFGIEASIVDYVRQARQLTLFAARDAARPGEAVGFTGLKTHNASTAEVYVMGVREPFQRRGVGRGLLGACEAYATAGGMAFLTVKTLAPSNPSEHYARTRAFYTAMGFAPLEVFPALWDARNPCLMLAKCLRCR